MMLLSFMTSTLTGLTLMGFTFCHQLLNENIRGLRWSDGLRLLGGHLFCVGSGVFCKMEKREKKGKVI